jgi:hypothetical protein
MISQSVCPFHFLPRPGKGPGIESNLSPSLEGDDPDTVIKGMTRSGSPSLHAILEESPNEDDSTLSLPHWKWWGGAVSTRREKACQRTTPWWPHAHADRATSGPRWRPFGSVNSVSRACCVRALSACACGHDSAEQRRHSRGEATVQPAVVDR